MGEGRQALKKYMAKHKIESSGLVKDEEDELERTGTCGGRGIGGMGQSKELYDKDDDGLMSRQVKKTKVKRSSSW